MYLNPDGIASPGGMGNQRLGRLMAVHYKAHQVTSGIGRLEKQGLVRRDLRVDSTKKPTYNVTTGKLIPRNYGIYLAVERDELPIDLQYVQELRQVIQERMAARDTETKAEVKKETRVPKRSGKVVVVQQQLPVQPLASDDARVADALLRRVVDLLTSPPKVEQPAIAEVLRKRITDLEGRLEQLQKNADVLAKRVDELGAENEMLKTQARGFRERGGKLTESISNLLAPEDRAALSRLVTERPQGEHVDKPRPV